MGSVKDLQILKKPTENEMGIGRFVFSDDYSVFDWGKMPDTIKDKGAALCLSGACCFEEAERQGIKTHYRGLVEDGKVVKLDELKAPTNIMEVSLVNVIKPEFKKAEGRYDYSMYNGNLVNFLIPLEVIYRNTLPEGSSVFKRLAKGETTYQDLGLDHLPVPGERLEKPIFEATTKLESTDRSLKWPEAQALVKLANEEIAEIKETLSKTNSMITYVANKAGLVNADGKIELAYGHDGHLMIVDVFGTLDECRFMYKGTHVSKEVARQFYKKTPWYQDTEEAKALAKEQNTNKWKDLCKSQPAPLDSQLKRIISEMYTSVANAFLGRQIFNAPNLEHVIEEYREKEWGDGH